MKIFSEDGMGKVVEIPADMTARDLCQLLVYKSHCVDDNSWALVEHHPLLGLGKEENHAGLKKLFTYTQNTNDLTYTGASTFMHACVPDRQFRGIFSRRHVFKHECMHILYIICTHRATVSRDLIKYNAVAI